MMEPVNPDRTAALHQRARVVGQITAGLLIGCLLVPALLELASLVGGISAFKYQGF